MKTVSEVMQALLDAADYCTARGTMNSAAAESFIRAYEVLDRTTRPRFSAGIESGAGLRVQG